MGSSGEKKNTWPQQTSAETGREKGTTLQPSLGLTLTTMSRLASGFRQNQFYSLGGWLDVSSTGSLSPDHISNDSIIGQEQSATNQAGTL